MLSRLAFWRGRGGDEAAAASSSSRGAIAAAAAPARDLIVLGADADDAAAAAAAAAAAPRGRPGSRKARKAAGAAQQQAAPPLNPFAAAAAAPEPGGASRRRSSRAVAALVCLAVAAAVAVGVGVTLGRRGGGAPEEEPPPVDGFVVVRNMQVRPRWGSARVCGSAAPAHVQGRSPPLAPRRPAQLERDCRPFFSAGFNAYNLVELALVTSPRYLTVGAQQPQAAAQPSPWRPLLTCALLADARAPRLRAQARAAGATACGARWRALAPAA
jgi:hypothetical protein